MVDRLLQTGKKQVSFKGFLEGGNRCYIVYIAWNFIEILESLKGKTTAKVFDLLNEEEDTPGIDGQGDYTLCYRINYSETRINCYGENCR